MAGGCHKRSAGAWYTVVVTYLFEDFPIKVRVKQRSMQMERLIISIIAIAIILIEILSAFCWYKKYFPLNHENVVYVMNSARGYFSIGIILTALTSFVSTISILYIDDIFIFWIFYFFVPFSVYLCIAALLEKCVIKADALTFYTPPLPPKKIKICEITDVKYKKDPMPYGLARKALTGYHNKKLLFCIREREKGYDILLSTLIRAGKIEPPPVLDVFSVTGKTDSFLQKIYSAAICFVFLIRTPINKRNLCFLILWLVLILYLLLCILHALLWKITINSHRICILPPLGSVKAYEISQITEIQEHKRHIVLFTGREKIVKISKKYENFNLFFERLKQNGVTVQKMY